MKWWHTLVPKYGNWGGPHWGAGKRFNTYEELAGTWDDESCAPIDAMDAVFRRHDKDYVDGVSRLAADARLFDSLYYTTIPGLYPNAYRLAALAVFGTKVLLGRLVGWLTHRE